MWEVTYIDGSELCVLQMTASHVQEVIYNLPGVPVHNIIKIERIPTRIT